MSICNYSEIATYTTRYILAESHWVTNVNGKVKKKTWYSWFPLPIVLLAENSNTVASNANHTRVEI